VKVANLTRLLTATVVLLVLLLVYMQHVGVSPRTVALIAAIAFFTISSSYIFISGISSPSREFHKNPQIGQGSHF
jgi:hypothetical protein